jgi:valyl-tRNA synthetase
MDQIWDANVSEAVKEVQREKLRAAELECGNFEKSIAQFKNLRMN